MYKVFVEPINKNVEVEEGANLRESLIKAGVEIKSPCGGCASCSRCVVIIKSGAENLSEIEFTEKQILGNVFHLTQERLSCQTKVMGNVHVDVSLHLEVEKPKAKKIVRKKRVEVEEDKIKRKAERDAQPPKEGGWRKPKSFKYSKED